MDRANMMHQLRKKRIQFIGRCIPGRRSSETEGFTLVELMIVIAIIGILVAIAIPAFTNYRTKAKNAIAISEIKMLEREIELYEIDYEELPEVLTDVPKGDIPDPWGNPYEYSNFAGPPANKGKGGGGGKGATPRTSKGKSANSDYDLYSKGRDGQSSTAFDDDVSQDDIVRADDGGYVGRASGYK